METSVLRTASETTETVDVATIPRREQLRTWAGHGTGVTCNGCGEPIKTHEIEYEVELPPGSDVPGLNFHLACYRTWTGRGSR
jgi:hypothetical protein